VGLVHKLRVEVFWGKTKFSNIPGEKNAHQRLDCTINLYELSQMVLNRLKENLQIAPEK